MSNPKATARLKRINAEAKKIRKANPNKAWKTCLREAGKKVSNS